MSNFWAWAGVLMQLYLMRESWKMRRDAIHRGREMVDEVVEHFNSRRCGTCAKWYSHPENEGRETACPFKYHPREVEYCSCWTLREESEC